MTFPDESFDEVRMWHTLEHLTAKRGKLAVEHVFRVLRPGGVFDVEVPDMDRLCKQWFLNIAGAEWTVADEDERAEMRADRDGLLQWFYSEDVDGVLDEADLNAHRTGFNEDILSALLSNAGFRVGDRLETGLALRYRAVRPAQVDL